MTSLPKTMSGVQISAPGSVDVLNYRTDLPVPGLKEGEVLVKNEYIGVNFIDTYVRTGTYPVPLPAIPGTEGAGTIAAVHPSVTDAAIKPGLRIGYIAFGAYAEYTAVPAARLVHLPENVSIRDATGCLLQGLTALTFVCEVPGLGFPTDDKKHGAAGGPFVLVHAAAGGTGLMLVQILRAAGARIIGTASTQEKRDLATKNGAQWMLDSRNDDLVAKVMEITGGQGVNVVFDGVGKATFDKDFDLVARKGTIVSFGNASGLVPPVGLMRLASKNVVLVRPTLTNYIATRDELDSYSAKMFELIANKSVVVKVDREYALSDAAQAHTDLEGRLSQGKFLLKV